MFAALADTLPLKLAEDGESRQSTTACVWRGGRVVESALAGCSRKPRDDGN